ncbi:MAG: bifunctional riboflavin kinase/FAD synthetase [Betaproteobacteria bacterium]|nr:bifunctional riboflavin kinase/FAD synthetase [Betaproteobacteria bacterium]
MRIIRRPVDSDHAADSSRVAALPCVLTIGNFDGVHLGHQALLRAVVERARQRGILAALLSFWPHPQHFFARRFPDRGITAPSRLSSRREQWSMVARCGIDRLFALRFDEKLALCPAETFIARDLVSGMRVRHLVVGDDFRFGANRRGDFAMLVREGERWGFTVESIDSVLYNRKRVSSSQVREALAQGRFDQAEALLGRPYTISGHVVHGRKLGRTLGFPTLNLRIDAESPALRGIFVVRVFGLKDEGATTEAGVAGVASLGTRPAVEAGGRFLLEVHLLDWSREVYGRIVHVEFLHKLRDEAHFPSLEALRAQIEMDRNAAIAYQHPGAVNSRANPCVNPHVNPRVNPCVNS